MRLVHLRFGGPGSPVVAAFLDGFRAARAGAEVDTWDLSWDLPARAASGGPPPPGPLRVAWTDALTAYVRLDDASRVLVEVPVADGTPPAAFRRFCDVVSDPAAHLGGLPQRLVHVAPRRAAVVLVATRHGADRPLDGPAALVTALLGDLGVTDVREIRCGPAPTAGAVAAAHAAGRAF